MYKKNDKKCLNSCYKIELKFIPKTVFVSNIGHIDDDSYNSF